MKRFYTKATARKSEACWALLLDGRPARTPRRNRLTAPNQALAVKLAAEWNAQGETIDPADMPLTRFLNVLADMDDRQRAELVAQSLAYVDTDLLAYKAEETALASRQAQCWGAVRDWAATNLDCPLSVTTGLMPIRQPQHVHDAAARYLQDRPHAFHLAFAQAVALTGSFLLAAALAEAEISAERAFEWSRLDETFQEEQWGIDEEAAQRAASLAREISFTASVLDALRAG